MAASKTDPFTLELSAETLDKLDQAIMRRVETVVNGCEDRDDDLLNLHLMLEGISQPTGTEPWPNACEIESTLAREFHTTLHASLSSSCKQFPYCITQPAKAVDQEESDQYERFINVKVQQDGYEDAIDDILYTALESKYAPMYVGYSQDTVKSFELGYRLTDWPEGQTITGDLRQPDETYEETLLQSEDVVGEGLDFRPILPWNCYTDPIDAPGFQIKHGCARVIERISMTREDLERGILDLGYDKKKTKELIGMGATQPANQSHKLELNEDAGLNSTQSEYWECFQVVGRLPYTDDDVPERLRYVDFVWLVCPAHNIAFKRAFSPFPLSVRPYVSFCAFHKPGFMLGNGLVSLLQDVQNEMTALERFGINKLNLEATPMMSVPERWLTKYSKWKVAPGRMMPRVTDNPHELTPITWDTSSQNYIMAWMERLDNYASRLAAAQSANSALGGKVRKATEVQFADAMMQTKFDLIQSNINRGIKEVFGIVAALVAQHTSPSDIPADDGTGVPPKLTLDTLRKNFRFIPQANAEGANSSLRLQKGMVVAQIARQSAVFQQAVMGGNMAPDWTLTHRLLSWAGWREPEELIGPKPSPDQGGDKQPSDTIIKALAVIFKDSPVDVRAQIEQALGLKPSSLEQMSPAMAAAQNPGAPGAEADPNAAPLEAATDLHKQDKDHQHELTMQLMKFMHERQMKGMDLQHKSMEGAQQRALQAHEGEQSRETQIQQAKLRPVGSNGNGKTPAKTNGKGH